MCVCLGGGGGGDERDIGRGIAHMPAPSSREETKGRRNRAQEQVQRKEQNSAYMAGSTDENMGDAPSLTLELKLPLRLFFFFFFFFLGGGGGKKKN